MNTSSQDLLAFFMFYARRKHHRIGHEAMPSRLPLHMYVANGRRRAVTVVLC